MEAKTQMCIRLDSDLVRQLDEMAAVAGTTRTAVIQRICYREVKATHLVGRVSQLKQLIAISLQPLEGDPVVEWLLSGPPESSASVKQSGRSKKS